MKAKRPFSYKTSSEESLRVKEITDVGYHAGGSAEPAQPMVRTQIYLSGRQQEFLQRQARREGETMAGMIRRFIDEKMQVPADAWSVNTLLDLPPEDPAAADLPEDGSTNLDYYVYGSPKRQKTVRAAK